MKPSHFYSRIVPAFALLFLITSCQKNDNPAPSSQDPTKTLLMNATNDIVAAGNEENQDVADAMSSDNTETGDSTSDCRVVTFNPSRSVYPHEKIIDFGTGCTGGDGIIRKGEKRVTIYANSETAPAGTLISETTFSNFYVDGIKVTGNVKSYVDASANPGPRIIKVVVNKGLISSNGDSKTFTATHYWKQTAGAGTPTHQDDVFEITGSAAGNETLDGATAIQWTSAIDSFHPVIKPGDCYYRTQGAVNVQLHIVTGGGRPLFFWPLSL